MINKIKRIVDKYRKMSNPLKATFWFVICSFAQRGVSILTTPIFTRVLSTVEYGKYSVFDSWLDILTIIFSMKLCTGVYMRGLVKNNEKREEYTSSLVFLSFLIILFWFATCTVFKKEFLYITGLDNELFYFLFLIIITSTGFGFWSSLKRVLYDYKKLISITLLVSILQPMISIVFVLSSNENQAVARVCGITVASLLVYGPLIISMLIKGKCLFNYHYWKEAIFFNLPLIPHFLSQTILNHSDRLMINKFCGEASTGIYSLAYSLAMIMLIFNTSIQNTLSPWTYQQLKEKTYNRVSLIYHSSIIFIGVINLILILIAPEILTIFAPSSYHDALNVIPPVAMSVYFIYVYGLFVIIEMYYGKNKNVMIASMTGALLNVILNMLFIPRFGYTAAAYTTLISYILYCFMHAIFTQSITKKNNFYGKCYNIKYIFLISIIFIVLGFFIYKLYSFIFFRYGVILIMFLLALINRKKIELVIKQFLLLKGGKK